MFNVNVSQEFFSVDEQTKHVHSRPNLIENPQLKSEVGEMLVHPTITRVSPPRRSTSTPKSLRRNLIEFQETNLANSTSSNNILTKVTSVTLKDVMQSNIERPLSFDAKKSTSLLEVVNRESKN